jgi:pimeloyl-ACP methyl ester carboxylesterase
MDMLTDVVIRSGIKSGECLARSLLMLLMALLAPSAASAPPPGRSGLQRGVAFSAYSPLSSSTELVRRLLSPLNVLQIRRELARTHRTLRAQPIDLARETFALYVPSGPPPPRGYGLLVFVSPWDDARVPLQWIVTLDREHVIFVTAANSGNDVKMIDRREPLALLAEAGVARRYPVDPARIYIGGFSGGSHTALRLALAYPDVFRGALLDAGSDPIGTARIPLPPADLFREFQESTRLVFLTGADDQLALEQDLQSQQSLFDWCVFDVATVNAPSTGHELAEPRVLDRALLSLERRRPFDSRKLAACRARIQRNLGAELLHVRTLIGADKVDEARDMLEKIDAQYGGLAAPPTVDLMQQIGAQP